MRRASEGDRSVYDDAIEDTPGTPLSHEPLCVRCGHSAHVHLPCGGGCDCEPTAMPGEDRLG